MKVFGFVDKGIFLGTTFGSTGFDLLGRVLGASRRIFLHYGVAFVIIGAIFILLLSSLVGIVIAGVFKIGII